MTDLYGIVVTECSKHGGPTDRCLRIYREPYTSVSGISRRRYWEAVQEGMNRHRARQQRMAA
jgi:hypothetical protein